jgi:hypothetical protein
VRVSCSLLNSVGCNDRCVSLRRVRAEDWPLGRHCAPTGTPVVTTGGSLVVFGGSRFPLGAPAEIGLYRVYQCFSPVRPAGSWAVETPDEPPVVTTRVESGPDACQGRPHGCRREPGVPRAAVSLTGRCSVLALPESRRPYCGNSHRGSSRTTNGTTWQTRLS